MLADVMAVRFATALCHTVSVSWPWRGPQVAPSSLRNKGLRGLLTQETEMGAVLLDPSSSREPGWMMEAVWPSRWTMGGSGRLMVSPTFPLD